MTQLEQAIEFVQGLQAAGCCCCLTSLLALGQSRGFTLPIIMQALDAIRAAKREAMKAVQG